MDDNSFLNVDLSRLRQVLTTQFSISEIKTLCQDLGVEYENLPGQTRLEKARELVEFMNRRGRLTELEERLQRPSVFPSRKAREQNIPKFAVIIVVILLIIVASFYWTDMISPRQTGEGTAALHTPDSVSIVPNQTEEARAIRSVVMATVNPLTQNGTAEGYETAVAIIAEAKEQYPDIAVVQYELAQARYDLAIQQDTPKEKNEIFLQVIRDLGGVISREPEHIDAFVLRGRAFINVKDYPEAIVDFERVISLGREDTQFQVWLGQSYIGDNKNREAIDLFSKLIRLDDTNGVYYCWRGAAYIKNKEFDKAESDLQKAESFGVDSTSPCKLEEQLQRLQAQRSS